MISETITMPGEPPVPPKPVPDCTQWRYFVERWELIHTESRSHSVPTIVGYDTITYNFGGTIVSYEVPRTVSVPVTTALFTFEWIAEEFNGCGRKLALRRSGIKHTSSTMLSDNQLANAIIGNEAQSLQLKMWNEALLRQAEEVTQDVMDRAPSTGSIVTGAYATAREGLSETQRRIEAAMRDYAYKIELYNAELESHEQAVNAYNEYSVAKDAYQKEVDIVANMIREDKVGTAYTVKGAGNKTVSLTVGQEITGADLISSGIQSTGSGYAIDPDATYIITNVELTTSAPRVNVPGLHGISFPGRITITK